MRRGAVNVLVGENGAGKSTLVKMIAGVEQPTAGRILLDGKPVRFADTADAMAHGIGMVFQELNLFGNLSVAENIFANREIVRRGRIDHAEQERQAAALMERLQTAVDPRARIEDLMIGQQQLVEIAKAVARNARILIMDEPTSALSAPEVEILFRVIADLKAKGVAIVYISHRLEELIRIGDYITVLRDGRVTGAPADDRRRRALDRPPDDRLRRQGFLHSGRSWIRRGSASRGRHLPAADHRRLCRRSRVADRSRGRDRRRLRSDGRGAQRVPRMRDGPSSARVRAHLHRGQACPRTRRRRTDRARPRAHPRGPAAGRARADPVRRREPDDGEPAASSTTGFHIQAGAEAEAVKREIKDLSIKVADPALPVSSLSGGNQQKVVIGKALLTAPKVLLMDEPSRGIDIGAKADVFRIMRGLAAQGIGIVFVTSDLDEVLALVRPDRGDEPRPPDGPVRSRGRHRGQDRRRLRRSGTGQPDRHEQKESRP